MKRGMYICVECGSNDVEYLGEDGYMCYECGYICKEECKDNMLTECPFCGSADIFTHYVRGEAAGIMCNECNNVAYYNEE